MAKLEFDEDFAGPTDFAKLYRSLGLQVVPAKTPSEAKEWKRPVIKWKEHENDIVDQGTFDAWYGPSGEHRSRQNMGAITGNASGRLIVIDLDIYKSQYAQDWLNDLVDTYNHGGWLNTPTQKTGGGGLQIFLRCPDWYTPPTNKTSVGIDVRGQGGFVMLPPSRHESGSNYAWVKSYEPWRVDIMEIPVWMIEAIDDVIAEYGGATTSATGPKVTTDTPEQTHNAFGAIIDGREDYMRKLVWAKVVDLYRDFPSINQEISDEECRAAFTQYEQAVRSRLAEPGVSNADLLEKEGRGWSEFRKKWNIAISKWETDVKTAAAVPKKAQADVKHSPPPAKQIEMVQGDDGVWRPQFEPFPLTSVRQIKSMPDQVFIIDQNMPENALGFVFGTPGCGKTFVELGKGLSIAAGLSEWWGYKINKHGPVIYITSEGIADMKFRIAAWEQETGISADDIPFYLMHAPINFMDKSEVERLILSIEHSPELMGIAPVAVWVDTVSRVLPGADENLQKDMTLFIKSCDMIRTTFGCTVTGVHHTNKDGRMRGSTVFDGAADFVFHVRREKGESIGEYHAQKMKAAADGWSKHFKTKEVTVDIAGHTSLYVSPTDEAPAGEESGPWPSRHVCREIIQAMHKAWEDGKPWSTHPNTRRDGRYAPMIMTKWEIEEKLAERMINDWLLNDLIEVEIRDSKARIKGLRVIDPTY